MRNLPLEDPDNQPWENTNALALENLREERNYFTFLWIGMGSQYGFINMGHIWE